MDSMKVKDYLPTVNQDCGNAPKYEKLLERHIGILKMEAGLKREFFFSQGHDMFFRAQSIYNSPWPTSQH